MGYREERITQILNYLASKNIVFRTNGKNRQVMHPDDADFNVIDDVRKLGYKVVRNKKGTICKLSDGKHNLNLDFRANNVSSSSMLSACFFALMLNNQSEFKKWLKDLFLTRFKEEIDIPGDVNVELEWVDRDGDKSHIDALITFTSRGVEHRMFTEVKYCEDAYGSRKRYYNKKTPKELVEELKEKFIQDTKSCFDNHSKKLNIDGYLDKCVTSEDYENSHYSKRYQIIRNVSHSRLDKNDYCLFLLAKGNTKAVEDIEQGLSELKQSNKELISKRVGIVFFEDLLDRNSNLYEKYFD